MVVEPPVKDYVKHAWLALVIVSQPRELKQVV
jgi:hypothetical protein